MDILVSASILAADFSKLGEEIARMEEAGADLLHIDVMDGVFVPNISFGLPVIKTIRRSTGMFFDVHLMITDPVPYIERFAEAGADGITFHYETAEDPSAVIAQIRAAGKRAGMSICPATPAEKIFPYLSELDLLLVMTVEPGFGGQSFRYDMLEKIRCIRAVAEKSGLPLRIQVDGGLNDKTAPEAIGAGADVLVAGSYLFRSADPASAVRLLKGIRD